MRMRRLGLIAVLLLGIAGCARRPVYPIPFLPIPGEDSRWEVKQENRVPLPLRNAGHDELFAALKWGLNRKNVGKVIVDPDPDKKYGQFFQRLRQSQTRTDLESVAYKQWFPGPMVKQVVDARDEVTPRNHAPVGLSDGTYWWVFYRDEQDRLTGVMVVKFNALQTPIEKKN